MKTKVYYADTDAGGVVYYANYLRWLEMARADWLEQLGTPIKSYVEQGVIFAVVRAEVDYHKPAVLGDEVEVTVEPSQLRRVRFTLNQDVVPLRRSHQTRVGSNHGGLPDAGGTYYDRPAESGGLALAKTSESGPSVGRTSKSVQTRRTTVRPSDARGGRTWKSALRSVRRAGPRRTWKLALRPERVFAAGRLRRG